MRLTTSMFRRRIVLAAPLVALDPPTTRPNGARPACVPDDADTALALSETQGQLARTQAAILRIAQQLEARHVRYSWTERLAADLRAIAHDTMGG